jgi:nicotinate dehydrogenase subunit B
MTISPTHEPRTFDRDAFLKGSGALIVGFSLLGGVAGKARAATAPFPIGPADVDPSQLDSWLAIASDGSATIFTGKEELGQGVGTATLQVAADELDVPFDSVKLVIADTWRTVEQGYSSGSNSLRTEYGKSGVRQACAEARAALLSMAATKLGAPVSSLQVSKGVVSVGGDTKRSVSYAELVGGKKLMRAATGKATPKPFTQYRIVGTSVPRVDIPPKIFGFFTYTQDIKVPGMLQGRVVRPPTLDSTLLGIDGFPGLEPEGLVKVVAKHNYVGVVAHEEWQAIQAADMLKVRWKTAPLPSFDTLYDDLKKLSSSSEQVLVDTGDVDAKLGASGKTLTGTYAYPVQMHGSMGASCAVADVRGNTATVFTSSQGVYHLRGALATLLGLPERNIHVIYVEGSGCYGLNGADDAALDAAFLSQAVARPVRVQYSRADEHKWENFGVPYVINLTAALDGTGKRVAAWSREGWTASRGGRPGPPANLATGVLLGFPEGALQPSSTNPSSKPTEVDGGNAVPSYAFPSERIVTHTGVHAFLHGPLRAPNRIQNTFATELFMDELARAAGLDSVNFRLNHLHDPRLIAVFRAAADMSSWEYRPPASKIGPGRVKTGRGIAGAYYAGRGGWAAVVANVSVDTKTGKVTVNHVWAAQDSGPVVNPDGMRAQAEGGVMQGISRALIEELKWDANGITSDDWVTYPVIRFQRMPKLDFQAIDRKNEDVVGSGEVVVNMLPGAIANAIFDATGKPVRQVPFTPARVRAALAA